jgi:hypothetical protein
MEDYAFLCIYAPRRNALNSAEADFRSTSEGSYSASAWGFAVVGLYGQGGAGHRDGQGPPARWRGLVPAGHDDADGAGRPPSLPGASDPATSAASAGKNTSGRPARGRRRGPPGAGPLVSAALAGPLESDSWPGPARHDEPRGKEHEESHRQTSPRSRGLSRPPLTSGRRHRTFPFQPRMPLPGFADSDRPVVPFVRACPVGTSSMTQITRSGAARGDHLGDQVADHIESSRRLGVRCSC